MPLSDYKLLSLHLNFFQFFALSGFPCPSLMNPSDHFLRTINKDFDKVSTSYDFKRLVSESFSLHTHLPTHVHLVFIRISKKA